ncbi:MAG TPA: carbohydrate kinase family protein [Anaerolineales bacterium]|nr:carbohydrate kinase family protein [Anaerolineales bacterium]
MILCYGGIALETVIELPYDPIPGVAHIICEERSRLGGGSGHVAEWLASWEVPTRLAGYVLGADPDGDRLVRWLSAYPSLDLRFLERSDTAQTLVSRTVPFADGSRYLLCIGYADVTVTAPRPELLDGVSILEVAFYHRQERGNAAAAEMTRLALAHGIRVTAMDVITGDEVGALAGLDLIINSAASIREQYSNADPFEHARALQARSGGIVIVTNGARETLAIDADGSTYRAQPPTVPITDATGAGDSFRAGMIYGLHQGWHLPECLRWATAVGALQVQRSLIQAPPPGLDQVASLARQIDVHAQ